MKIKIFWVVTKPTPKSTLADICFESDVRRLSLQFAGGLNPEEIHALYTNGIEARTVARWLLDQRSQS